MTDMTTAVATITYRWSTSDTVAQEAAAFAARVVGSDTRYISHGEIQTGLSDDGKHWVADLPRLYARDFGELGESRDLLVARDAGGTIVGIAVVAWEETPRRRFAVLEDMAVEVDMRSHGIGERLLKEVEAIVAERKIGWLFLESGIGNAGAHRFFERHGFTTLSHVFGKTIVI